MRTEDAIRSLLTELAEATPVRDAPPLARARHHHADPSPAYIDGGDRRGTGGRGRWLAAGAAAVVILVLGLMVVVRGGRERGLVTASDGDISVDFAALGGGRLAFVVDNNLFVADGATSSVRKLTDVGVGNEVSNVSMSGDGNWVTFSVHGVTGWWISSIDGSNVTHLSDSSDPSSAAWSPRRPELAFALADEVRVADAGREVMLSGPAPWPYTNVAWSPDGEQVAYATRDGAVAIVAVDGSAREMIEPRDRRQYQVVIGWVPDDGAGHLAGPLAVDVGAPDPDGHEVVAVRSGTSFVLAPSTSWQTPTAYAALAADGSSVALVAAVPPVVLGFEGLGADIAELPAGPWRDPALSPTGDRLAAFSELGDFYWFDTPSVENVLAASLLHQATSARGTIRRGSTGYGVEPEPPVWVDDAAVLARVDEDEIVRFDVVTGTSTTVVDGARFLETDGNYPGGSGLAYWRP